MNTRRFRLGQATSVVALTSWITLTYFRAPDPWILLSMLVCVLGLRTMGNALEH